ncbi:MAG: hypothetical protein GC159_23615 [Phycisphaera sp.]|nr:hypothetical protein [Phycisphaera sp.]
MSNDASMSRRAFLNDATLGSLMTYSLLHTMFVQNLFADELKPEAVAWLKQVNDMSKDLRGNKITQTQWQDKVEELYKTVDLDNVLKLIDYDKLSKAAKFRERGETAFHPPLPKVEGLPTDLVFGNQVFGMSKGHSVTPHGHQRMATSFIVLSGEFRGRHYDRVEDHKDHMIIRPTIDGQFKPGQFSTISDHRDNVHWFTATSEVGYIFNIHVLNLESDEFKTGGRVYIDPTGEKNADGLIVAPKITARDSLAKFG